MPRSHPVRSTRRGNESRHKSLSEEDTVPISGRYDRKKPALTETGCKGYGARTRASWSHRQSYHRALPGSACAGW